MYAYSRAWCVPLRSVTVLLKAILLSANKRHLGECDLALHAEVEGAQRALETLALDSKSRLENGKEQAGVFNSSEHFVSNEVRVHTGSQVSIASSPERVVSTSDLERRAKPKKTEAKAVTGRIKGRMPRVS